MFFVMMPLYYIFFTSQIMNIVAIMTQITLILVVIMEYTYVASGVAVHDSVEIVAGKVQHSQIYAHTIINYLII